MVQVAVVILNWNGKHWLQKFLPNVIEHSPEAEIIVADNGSSDDSLTFLQTEFPDVRIVQNAQNGGFAKGYNDALRHIEAKYYVLLNSDIEVTAGWLQPLLHAMEDETVVGCQPKIRAYGNRTHFEHAGAAGGYIDKNYYPFCRGRLFDLVEEDKGQYDGSTEIFWASGACLMIRADQFHQVGGFDEDFFAHMEEIDLCWRLKKMGFRFLAVPSSVVYHVGGGTLDYSSPNKVYLNFRNNLYMIVKNHEGWLFGKIFHRLCLDSLAGFLFLTKGEFKKIGAVLKAHGSLYKNLGKMKRKRKEIKAMSTKFNPVGLYRGGLLWAFFFKRIRAFSGLNQRLFSGDPNN